eukprot:2751412-Rhodomonas_salina.1
MLTVACCNGQASTVGYCEIAGVRVKADSVVVMDRCRLWSSTVIYGVDAALLRRASEGGQRRCHGQVTDIYGDIAGIYGVEIPVYGSTTVNYCFSFGGGGVNRCAAAHSGRAVMCSDRTKVST